LYAKQAEYAIRLETPFLFRFAQLISLPWIGAGIALLPGFLACLWWSWSHRSWVLLSACLWWIGYTGIYAAVLPVDYQPGRYLIPAMPVYFVLSLAGSLEIIRSIASVRSQKLVRAAWVLIVGITWVLFYIQGAWTYARDVAIIETEMVATGQWVAQNIRPEALIAAHDIGALGYFGKHQILDLAGLVTPAVIPMIRNEEKLSAYMTQNHVDYFITFPGWYPLLVQPANLIYKSPGLFSPQEGGENMSVYRWMRNDP
jgi:hypothetical protein